MAKKTYMSLARSIDYLLDKEKDPFEIDDIENKNILTNKELEESMNDVRGINSMDDLRPDDYKGFSISLTKLFNVFKRRKG